jgi:hypothetical protein
MLKTRLKTFVIAAAALAQLKEAYGAADAMSDPQAESKQLVASKQGNMLQLQAAQGGTLGIASQGLASGMEADADIHFLGAGGPATPDLMANFGGLQPSDNVRVDVFAEIADQNVPRLVLTGTNVDHSRVSQRLSSVGLRVQLHFWNSFFYSVDDLPKDKKKACENAAYQVSGFSQLRAWFLDPGSVKKDNPRASKYLGDAGNLLCDEGSQTSITAVTTHSISVGGRIVDRTGVTQQGSTVIVDGGAAEILYQYDEWGIRHGWSAFVGLSGILISKTTEKPSDPANQFPTTEYPRFSTVRLSAGYEYRGGVTTNKNSIVEYAPRLGLYAVGSKGFWTDRYSMSPSPPFDTSIASNQFEAGAYLAGKISNGFHGMVALRAVKPLGNDWQFILSVIPGAASDPPKTDGAEKQKTPPSAPQAGVPAEATPVSN